MSKSYTTSGAEYVTKNTKELFIFSDTPLSTEEVAERLNDMLQDKNVPLLTACVLEKWLTDAWLISTIPGTTNKKTTDDGKKLGISCEGQNIRLDKNGQIFVVSFINYITYYTSPAPYGKRNWDSDDYKALVYLIKKGVSFISIPLILKVSFKFARDKYFTIKDRIPVAYLNQSQPNYKAPEPATINASVIKADAIKTAGILTSSQNHTYNSCINCMLYKNETCFGKKEICEDFKPSPKLSTEEIERWPKYGDATRFKLGEKPPSD